MASQVTFNALPFFSDEVLRKVVKAGQAVLEPEVKRNLAESIEQTPKHYGKRTGKLLKRSERTGGLLASESTSPVFKNNNGARFVSKVYFKGQNKQGVRYGAIAAFKEYGVRKGRTQAASRFRDKAVSSKGNRAIAAMQQVLDEELNKQ